MKARHYASPGEEHLLPPVPPGYSIWDLIPQRRPAPPKNTKRRRIVEAACDSSQEAFALPASAPDRDAQPVSGLNAALGVAFGTSGQQHQDICSEVGDNSWESQPVASPPLEYKETQDDAAAVDFAPPSFAPVLSLEAWRAQMAAQAPQAGEPQASKPRHVRVHVGVAQAECEPCLEQLIDSQLSRWGRLWTRLRSSEGPRRRCICERLCRDAQKKYAEVVKTEARSWAEYLSRSQGRRRISEWVDKKVREMMAQDTAA